VRSPDAPSGATLRALLVEDSENDALLLAEELRRGGYEPVYERVSTPEGMERALAEASARGEPWKVILSDYYMPRFRAPDALALLRRLGYDTPFIIVSGKIGEDAAVAMMQAGAQDYVTKENLTRLCPAIERELREAAVRQEREKAEEALNLSREVQRLLAEAGAVLSSSLDYQATLESLARLVVPRLADWCAVDVVAEDGGTHRLVVEHENPGKVRWAHELQRRYPPDPDAPQGTPQVLRSGRSEFYPEITQEIIEAAARDEEHLRLLREMAFTSVIIVPLVARGKTLGAITLVSAESGRRFGEADLRVAEELARRAALAMDNAKLYEEAQKEITERRRAEEELRKGEERYRTFVEQSTEGIWRIEFEQPIPTDGAEDEQIDLFYRRGYLAECNDTMAQMYGYGRAEEIVGMSMDDLLPRSVPENVEYLRSALRSGYRLTDAESNEPDREGNPEYFLNNLAGTVEDGFLIRAWGTQRDITERKRAEEALRESEERFRATFHQAAVGVAHVGLDGRWLRVNERLSEIVGYPREELLGLTFQDITYPEDLEMDLDYVRRLLAGEIDTYSVEKRYLRKDGSLVWINLTASLMRAPAGEPVYFIAVIEDISERKRTEEALGEVREAERNRIARDLHDDILQDIVYALQEIQIMQVTSENGGNAALEDTAEALRRSVEGLRGAIFELRLKERLGRSFVSPLEILLDLNRRMARNRYELELDVEDGFPRMLSEKASQELTRIIQEALTNARRHSEARRVEVRLWRTGDLACAEVADDGRGFDAAQTGMGMGQHSMRHRALELGGELQVESEPGEGTRVRFHAPLSRLIEE
jgi:PAS domain S-box-containing protein